MANANSTNMSFYPFNRKNQLEEYRQRICSIDLPGLPPQSSKTDRTIFMNSVIPMNQELIVLSLGNLLKYLTDNHMKWNHAFLSLDKNPIITNVLVTVLESQVLLDETTFNALNIFSTIYHPSSFKLQIRKDGLSLFNLLNHCSSAVGTQYLKSMLKSPIRDMAELNLRFQTIEWCLKRENSDHVQRIKCFLGGFVNINAVLQRIIINHGKTNDWKSFKRTVYNAFSICELCSSLSAENVQNTFLEELATFCKEGFTINGILYALDKVVDLEAIEEKRRFIVKRELDRVLDEKRDYLKNLTETFNEMKTDESLTRLSTAPNSFHFVYFPETGFVVGTTLQVDQLNLTSMNDDDIDIVLQTNDAIYFKTPNSNVLNEEYDEKLADVIAHEMEIFNKLVRYINENFAELSEIAKICAKLDCLIAFSFVAEKYKYIKPKITTDRELTIINGRHPLVEQIKTYITNSTIVNMENKNFINIIRAPNSSGKSVYVKQIALIVYMAHIGCFVPCDSCSLSLLHSIFTRIYTPESMYQNESAFMSDLQQMSKVVMNSTNRSLILIDEFGKGTHHSDGIALMTSTIEHFIDRGANLCPFIFITTHYAQVYKMLKSKELTCLKTIVTKKNESNTYCSTFKVADGVNEQSSCIDFPEARKIMANIFNQKERLV